MFEFGESDQLELNTYKVLFNKMRKTPCVSELYICSHYGDRQDHSDGNLYLLRVLLLTNSLKMNVLPQCPGFAPDKTVLQS